MSVAGLPGAVDLPSYTSPPPESFVAACKTAKGPILGSVLTFPTAICAKVAARSGFDWVMIDMEHSPVSS
jgi:2-keto-3-deoxy-L-rhamnonate aldolase RhmA